MQGTNFLNALKEQIDKCNYLSSNDEQILLTNISTIRRLNVIKIYPEPSFKLYKLFNFPYTNSGKILQSLLFLILLHIILLIKKTKSIRTTVVENSRFKGYNSNQYYYLPGSFKGLVKLLGTKNQYLIPPSKKKTLFRSIKLKEFFNSYKIIEKFLKEISLSQKPTHILLILISYYLSKTITEMILDNITKYLTIGTIEPLQKFLSAKLLSTDRDVELYIHGNLYDPIAYFQNFNSIHSDTLFRESTVYPDLHYLSLFKPGKVQVQQNYPEAIQLNYSEVKNVIKGNRKILLFSTSYEPGMPIITPNSFFDLISKVNISKDQKAKIFIRLHPGENRKYFQSIVRSMGIFNLVFDEEDFLYDVAIGLPSTYIMEAKHRSNHNCFIYAKEIFFPRNFGSRYVY